MPGFLFSLGDIKQEAHEDGCSPIAEAVKPKLPQLK